MFYIVTVVITIELELCKLYTKINNTSWCFAEILIIVFNSGANITTMKRCQGNVYNCRLSLSVLISNQLTAGSPGLFKYYNKFNQ